MKKNSSKLPFRQRISITIRGGKMINTYCPGLLHLIFLSSTVRSLQPYATIWFSARILNELSNQRNIKRIVLYAVCVVAINYLLSILNNFLDSSKEERVSQMWCFIEKIFADKQLTMDFIDVEDTNVQQRKAKEKENLFTFGNGIPQFVWSTSSYVESGVIMIMSLSMTISLFTKTTGKQWLDSKLWILTLLIIIIIGGIAHSIAFEKQQDAFKEWYTRTSLFYRIFEFYGWTLHSTPERAKDIRIYQQNVPADHVLEKMQTHNKSLKKYLIKMSIYDPIATLLVGINYMITYLFVVLKAFYHAFGVGSIVQYVGALSMLGEGIQKLLGAHSDNIVYTKHLKSLFEFLDLPNKKYQGTIPVEKCYLCNAGENDYVIEFQNVSFRYPTSKEYAIRNLSMKINIGERLAIVGMNGSGKTTFIKLLCRLYDPTEGVILLNGIDIKKYNYDEYMSIFSVVFQDFRLFAFSLGQNIAASMNYDKERVELCLQKAGFKERLQQMPDGIETNLYKDFDENGVEISGGEAQKVALARALYKEAPFVLLDEPTAALDPIAEFAVYSKFNEIIQGKTAIYISHRLSSCRFCDDIAVFHEGRLIQRGNHDTLVADTDGKYYELWNAQAKYYN